MRELKFRAWNKIKNKMMVNITPLLNKAIYHNDSPTVFEIISLDHVDIMQFTGLKDKNGVEVYEGDIVKVDDDYDKYGMNSGEVFEIMFSYGGFRFKPKHNSKARGYYLEDDEEFEVIGNIYEDKKLLKDKA